VDARLGWCCAPFGRGRAAFEGHGVCGAGQPALF
jgi:hypothetical protein